MLRGAASHHIMANLFSGIEITLESQFLSNIIFVYMIEQGFALENLFTIIMCNIIPIKFISIHHQSKHSLRHAHKCKCAFNKQTNSNILLQCLPNIYIYIYSTAKKQYFIFSLFKLQRFYHDIPNLTTCLTGEEQKKAEGMGWGRGGGGGCGREQKFCKQLQDATYYLVGLIVVIQRPIEIFQMFLNKNCKECLRANHTSTHVDI